MTTTTESHTFGEKLRHELQKRDIGARTLARLLSRRYGQTVEGRRRTIIRWLQGQTPQADNRHMVEDVLGLARDSLKGDDEDEEPSLTTLENVLRQLVTEIVHETLERKEN